jgi:hypothetical protein
MRMNGDQKGQAGKLVAVLSSWVAPARPGALCGALELPKQSEKSMDILKYITPGLSTIGDLVKRYCADIIRVILEACLLYKVSQEVGGWTLTFAILVALSIETQGIANKIQSKINDELVKLIAKKDIENILGSNNGLHGDTNRAA